MDFAKTIAGELGVQIGKVSAVLALLGDKNTVPFIARYRKEVTGGLDEVAIRAIEERHEALVDLEKRRFAILKSLEELGIGDPALLDAIRGASTRAVLEDIYLPYRPKRRTRATIAREKGLEPLAKRILAQPEVGNPQAEAVVFVNPDRDVPDVPTALAGARDIVAETVSDSAQIRSRVREHFRVRGVVVSKAIKSKTSEPTKFETYYDFSEPVGRIASHRFLAIRRGVAEEVLRMRVQGDRAAMTPVICRMAGLVPSSPWADELRMAIEDAYDRLLVPAIETEILGELAEKADHEAIEVFAANLRELLMSAPFGGRSVIGIDPGIRTGCKCAAVDRSGAFLANITLYIGQGGAAVHNAESDLIAFVNRHKPEAIAIGNGTYGRETETFVKNALSGASIKDVLVVPVSESGASVYSASDIAREEFPDIDLTVRGAIHIARKFMDPLAELVKVDPKSIGVGQYQHDVAPNLLSRRLDQVVEDCVNSVGVELNTASAPLLKRVAGIGPVLAGRIVKKRNEIGVFSSRKQLLDVQGLGARTFEQAAGFCRIRGARNPLDASAVHPEQYALVERIAKDTGKGLATLIGDVKVVNSIDWRRYVSDDVGLPTLHDIAAELNQPGRDPREEFEAPAFRDDIRELADLQEGMALEGIVTNVTTFGAFVDIGVHQDGLVHVSQMSDRYVKDPAEVVHPGKRVTVRVIGIDLERRRISLSIRDV